ncbi:efflux RND transporter periplasmic adaptor subunit [Sulfitobacter guttiformis]|uniref:RND family efflux transporter MFP subunit n=1 Tax=Sulfitobacter guttiformis TaxID=74349 RepID=A0A420DTX9_9RHOB|nr:efflux RND transporter periplasmic adaptor subunit [Sulfitobacter guttiformis]KIN71085.1 Multidrug efflux pump, MFP family [Sulfitobacter guttiformis KCTC 32187]RKE97567.1 RND family efflux transporter MFP subunit [Sulfitobacter guttiformis]
MKAIRQIVLSFVVVAAGLYIWITYVPAAQPLLARLGILDLLGVEGAEPVQGEQGGGRPGGSGAATVITETVGEMVREDRITAIGDGRARRSVTVRSSAVGIVTDLSLASGGFVESGTVIVKLQNEEETIALEQARIQLDNARTEEARIKQLQALGTTTEVRLRETELALRSAELAVRQAEFALSQRQIAAPISGWVGIIDLEQGDRVNAQDVLVTITDRSEILIDFRVPERAVSNIKVGQTFDVSPLALPDKTLTGEISAIDTVVDRASRTLLVQGRVANDTDLLRAGMAFSVNLSFPGASLLSITPLAVQWSSEGPFVWVVREGKAAQVTVEIVQRNSAEVLVAADNLAQGDQVVTEGVQTLRNGAEVNVLAPDTSASAAIAGERP